MARVVVLGGPGGIGSIAVRTVVVSGAFDEVVVLDARADAAAALVDRLGPEAATVDGPGGSPVQLSSGAVDAGDAASVRGAVEGADVALNCVGPFYRFGPPVLEAVIEAGVDYVDVCDDLDATRRQLTLDDAARAAGVTALIGMGNSPGLANVLARYAADHLLETVESVDIMHIHGGEPAEGGAVVKHRIHAMTNDVPVFVDGVEREVRMLEPSGEEFIAETDFRNVGRFPVYPYPHPETITLPRHLPGLKRATNLGVVFPLSYFGLTMDMVRVGACATEPLEVDGASVVPLEFSVAHILRERPRLLAEAGVDGPAGCLKVVVAGQGEGGLHTWVFSLSSRSEGAGEGTGIPAGLGAVLMARGEVVGPGVVPPEAGVDPLAMLALAGEVVGRLGIGTGAEGSGGDAGDGGDGGDGGGAVPIHLEHILPDGSTEDVALSI